LLQALYDGPRQRLSRFGILTLLSLKHILRGLLFSWPLYLLGFSALLIPGENALWLLLFMIPGIWVSWKILWPGIHGDYQRYVKDVVFRQGALGHILFKVRAP